MSARSRCACGMNDPQRLRPEPPRPDAGDPQESRVVLCLTRRHALRDVSVVKMDQYALDFVEKGRDNSIERIVQ